MHNKEIGFTLIELLITIAIIGILAIVALPGLIASQKRSYDTGARMCAKSLQTAQAISHVDNETYVSMSSPQDKLEKVLKELNSHCRNSNIFYKDRSSTDSLVTAYIFDIWDIRGVSMITVTPTNISGNTSGATPFSNSGSGGQNFP